MNRLQPELKAIALILAVAILSATGVMVATAGSTHPIAAPPTPLPTVTPGKPTPVPSVIPGPLNGLPTQRALALRRPVAVVLDDFYPDARPLSGIGDASLVFETVVEGGITRLMAVYLERDASRVGPIRSARPYFVSWAAGLGALFVHAGGSPSAEQLLSHTNALSNVDALLPGPEFSRENDRISPHDLYGSTTGARAIAQRQGRDTSGTIAALPHRSDAPLRRRGRDGSVSISFSTPSVGSPPAYDVSYRYSRARNVYLRFQGGVPFVDRTTGKQVAAQNVVVLSTAIDLIPGDPLGRVSVGTVGRGNAVLFQNGHRLAGTWSRTSNGSPLQLLSSSGQPMTLVPGQTWIEAAPNGAVQVGASP